MQEHSVMPPQLPDKWMEYTPGVCTIANVIGILNCEVGDVPDAIMLLLGSRISQLKPVNSQLSPLQVRRPLNKIGLSCAGQGKFTGTVSQVTGQLPGIIGIPATTLRENPRFSNLQVQGLLQSLIPS